MAKSVEELTAALQQIAQIASSCCEGMGEEGEEMESGEGMEQEPSPDKAMRKAQMMEMMRNYK